MSNAEDIFQKLITSRFLIARRSNGYVCPGTMRLTDFDALLRDVRVVRRSYQRAGRMQNFTRFMSGIYIATDDGDFRNVHREIRKLLDAGLLEVVGEDYIKTLRVKESA